MQHIESAVRPLAGRSRQAIKAAGAPKSDDLMPVKAAATALDVSEMTVRRALEAGDFPGLQIGRTYRVSRPFVEALLAEVRSGRRVIVEEFAAEWLARASEGAA
ncbi:excisionase family DNA-binding protein [Actinomadura luteofluorescens]|uniref:excisionase family DNA-binding protein n=1 Tax=Actinomadura luteofluorescens TaxID=46163 RepID=UPI003D8AFA1D